MSDEFTPHPLRGRVLGEVHARPFAPVETPRRILHFAFMTDEEAAARDREALSRLCESLGVPGPSAGAKHHRAVFSGSLLRWESHSEFTTYTWEFDTPANGREPGEGSAPDPAINPPNPFRPSPGSLASVMRLVPQPGPLMVSVDLHLVDAADLPDGPQSVFGPVHIAAAEVEDGAALIATDFKPDAHGFVRILIMDRSLARVQAGGLVQRVIEIETYRTMALLGLPEAQALAPSIRRTENALPVLMEEMRTSEGFEDNRRLLDRLTTLAAELESGAASSLYRFGATRAYEELVRLRLKSIGEHPIAGIDSWSAFLSRRIQPAIRTCTSTEERQANLSRKLSRAAQLLRTRIEIELESQNRDLLQAMNARARVQLRLQQTVEGLSVAAITYYISGLIFRMLEGASRSGIPVDPYVGTAISIPFLAIALALTVRYIRRLHKDAGV
jgi:uncharacterized membrane-anchored protein